MSMNGVPTMNAQELGLLPMPTEIDWVINETKLLSRPAGKTVLVLQALVGDWQIKPGDSAASFPTAPGATTSNGSAYWPLKEGREIALAGPNKMTVKGTGTLVYYWA